MSKCISRMKSKKGNKFIYLKDMELLPYDEIQNYDPNSLTFAIPHFDNKGNQLYLGEKVLARSSALVEAKIIEGSDGKRPRYYLEAKIPIEQVAVIEIIMENENEKD